MGVLESERERKRRLRSGAKREYFDAVLRQVKFSWDHEDIENELDEHILEECAYLRAGKGLNDTEAEREALKRMGPPEQLGKLLNQAHNPWIGRVWLVTSAIVLLICIILLRNIMVMALTQSWPWKITETDSAAETIMYEYMWQYGGEILYHVECEEVMELENYSITFTDVYCMDQNPLRDDAPSDIMGLVFYELEYNAGDFAARQMSGAAFFDQDGRMLMKPSGLRNTRNPEERFGSELITGGMWDRFIVFYAFDGNTEYIDVKYDVFGEKAACRISLEDGIRQLKEEYHEEM